MKLPIVEYNIVTSRIVANLVKNGVEQNIITHAAATVVAAAARILGPISTTANLALSQVFVSMAKMDDKITTDTNEDRETDAFKKS